MTGEASPGQRRGRPARCGSCLCCVETFYAASRCITAARFSRQRSVRKARWSHHAHRTDVRKFLKPRGRLAYPTHDMIGAPERSVCRDLAGEGGCAMNAAMKAATLATPGPDAELIRACAQHPINMDAYNFSYDGNRKFSDPDGPLWEA